MPSTKLSILKPFQQHGGEWRTASTRGQPTKQRASSQRRPLAEESEDSPQNQMLFHTICGTSNAFPLPGPQNVFWFILEESLIDMFKNKGQLEEGKLRKTHEIVKALLDSDFGTLVYGRLKSQLLPNAMDILKSKLESGSGNQENYLATIESIWEVFFCQILPTLECMLYQIQSPATVSIRKAAIVAFRDHILLSGIFEEHLKKRVQGEGKVSDAIQQMLLVVQHVFECFPPSKNKIEIERLCALVVSPFLGYRGLYLDYNNDTPVVKSKEPELAGARGRGPRGLTLATSDADKLTRLMPSNGGQRRIFPVRKVSLQPVMEKQSTSSRGYSAISLNYLMARVHK